MVVGIMLVATCIVGAVWAARASGEMHARASASKLQAGVALNVSQQAYWKSRIQESGGAEAYKEFSGLISDMAVMQQHNLAHNFGSVLYEAEGFTGYKACDDLFSWGCAHEIISRSIEENGFAVVASLGALCSSYEEMVATGCYHGIGHGLVGWFGYSSKNLLESLTACDTYLPDSYATPLGGCYSGVFMEYALRTLTGLDTEGYRPASEGSFQELCFSLPEKYRVGCAFQAYQWWVTLSIDRSLERMAFIGEECRSFGRQDMIDACYMGVGDHLPVTPDRSPERIAALCSALSPEMGGRLLCQGFAAFITEFLSREGGELACTGLEGSDLEYCAKYADGKANWLHVEPLPEEYR